MLGSEGDNLLNGLCAMWLEKLRVANDKKKKQFQDTADEAMSFYAPPEGNFNFVYRGDKDGSKGVGIDVEAPSWRMTLHKVCEIVDIFGPILYHKNPVRQVNPRKPPLVPIEVMGDPQDPAVQQAYMQMAQMVAMKLTWYSLTTLLSAVARGNAPLTRTSIRSSVSTPPPPPQQYVAS